MPYKVKKNELSQSAGVLAEAFQDDPLWNKIIAEGDDKSKKHPIVAEILLRYCFKFGEVYASSENLEGVMAITQDKKSYMNLWGLLTSGAILPFMRLGGKSLAKMSNAFTPLDKARYKQMKGKSFIYLQVIGVSKDKQGKGHGRLLLQWLIEKSRQAGIPIYLETETERNVTLYEKLGFKTLEKMTLPVIQQPMWTMIREPEL